MMTALDDEKLESILYETSNVILYKIPSPNLMKVNHHIQEYHDINRWSLTNENILFKGVLRVKEQEFFSTDDSDNEEDSHSVGLKSAEEESAERFRLIVELINFHDQQVWTTIQYYNLSPHITTIDNTSFHSIQPVNNSNLFSTFIELEPGLKIGCGLKFPNRVESNNFQMVLSNYLNDLQNYIKMIKNNRAAEADENEISDKLANTQLDTNGELLPESKIYEREVSSTDDDDDNDDDDDFGDFVGEK